MNMNLLKESTLKIILIWPKKYALEKAINESKGEIILATDADCRVSNNWAISMAGLVNDTHKVVIGYSKVSGQDNLIHEIQKIDF